MMQKEWRKKVQLSTLKGKNEEKDSKGKERNTQEMKVKHRRR
jgi:hypothetical protein